MSTAAVGTYFLVQKQQKVEAESKRQDEGNGVVVAYMSGHLINEYGKIVRPYAGEDVPHIIVATDTISGGEIVKGEGIEKTIALLKVLEQSNIAATSVNLYNDDYIELQLSNTIRVLYTKDIDTNHLSSSLQSMLSVFTIEGRRPAEIDFRFDKPVIRF